MYMNKQTEKNAFSQRFKQQLTNRSLVTTSPTWLAREFNLRFSGASVSVQTASNWLSGNAIPSQDKLQVLAAWLEVSTQWLRFGESVDTKVQLTSNATSSISQYDIADLPKKIDLLTPQQKQLVYGMVEAILGKN